MNTDRSNTTPVALITGAAKRIGAATARRLHGAGFNIVVHYSQSAGPAQQLVWELNQTRTDSAQLVQADLLQTDAPSRLVEAAAGHWQGLDALVNNASSFYPTPVGDITEADWQDLVGTNLKAPLFLSQAAAPYLKARRGTIINITDVHAERPMVNFPVYTAAKAGLLGLTRALARELAPEVRVNAVAPGSILWPETQQGEEKSEAAKAAILQRTPLGRIGDAEDIARTIEFLVTNAPYITGQVIPVDGGRNLFI
jgi:pteridine reductase